MAGWLASSIFEIETVALRVTKLTRAGMSVLTKAGRDRYSKVARSNLCIYELTILWHLIESFYKWCRLSHLFLVRGLVADGFIDGAMVAFVDHS